MPTVQVAVLASGGGSNLQSLLDHLPADAPGRIALVGSDRVHAGALERARLSDLPTFIIGNKGDDTDGLLANFRSYGIGLVVLAGYLKLVPAAVVGAFRGRMLNIHPALLPAFGGPGMYGRRVHEAVLASGARVTGPTIHLVDEHYDKGPILAQWPVPVKKGDTADALAARVLEAEHALLPVVVRHACACLAKGEPVVPLSLAREHFGQVEASAPGCDDALQG